MFARNSICACLSSDSNKSVSSITALSLDNVAIFDIGTEKSDEKDRMYSVNKDLSVERFNKVSITTCLSVDRLPTCSIKACLSSEKDNKYSTTADLSVDIDNIEDATKNRNDKREMTMDKKVGILKLI